MATATATRNDLYTNREVGRLLGIPGMQAAGLIAGCGITPRSAGVAKVITHEDFLKVKAAHERSMQAVSA